MTIASLGFRAYLGASAKTAPSEFEKMGYAQRPLTNVEDSLRNLKVAGVWQYFVESRPSRLKEEEVLLSRTVLTSKSSLGQNFQGANLRNLLEATGAVDKRIDENTLYYSLTLKTKWDSRLVHLGRVFQIGGEEVPVLSNALLSFANEDPLKIKALSEMLLALNNRA